MKNLYKAKSDLVRYLSESGLKKIRTYHIEEAAEKFGLSKNQASLAWKNFVQFGRPDLRSKGSGGRGTPKAIKEYNKMLNSQKANPNFDLELKKKVLKDYFNGELIRVIINDHKVSVGQIYSAIRELNVSGSIDGKKLIAALNSGRKYLNDNEYSSAVRLKTVLDKYLLEV